MGDGCQGLASADDPGAHAPEAGAVVRRLAAGPRFWHVGMMLRTTQFWLCSHSSLSGRVGRADGPEQREVWTRVCNRSTIPPASPQFSDEGWDRQDQLQSITRLLLHHYTKYFMHLITIWSCLTAAPLKTLLDHLNRLGRASDRRPRFPRGKEQLEPYHYRKSSAFAPPD